MTYRQLADFFSDHFDEAELDSPILAYNPSDESYTAIRWLTTSGPMDTLVAELAPVQPNVKMVFPYFMLEHWVFDAPEHNLKEEAFVEGMTEIIERIVTERNIPNAKAGFCLSFSDMPFTGAHCALSKETGGNRVDGNWYHGSVSGILMRGWLCPSLYSYFPEESPEFLFFGAMPMPTF